MPTGSVRIGFGEGVAPVNRKRRFHAGFTLTEILMAVGILGVGLTMVAAVFPVAVDQSRRSAESTMAALCARSVSAYMRANRTQVLKWCRTNVKTKTAVMTGSVVPYPVRMYNPNSFLYDEVTDKAGKKKERRQYNTDVTDYGMWASGTYVPLMFATPMNASGYGPYRITIVVYKARGDEPGYVTSLATTPKAWKDSNPKVDQYAPNTYLQARPGEYMLDWKPTASTNYRAEAYMIDRSIPNARGTVTSDLLWLAGAYMKEANRRYSAQTADADVVNTGATGLLGWVSLPGSMAAYHTIVGD
jgi:prepilin-type N-terminal cleavage/methylation domain-containing protein